MSDTGASIIARLKQRAEKDGMQLQILLNLFCQEEFLRRISLSKYSDNLILKGGLLLYTISEFTSRPTLDADYLLKNYSNETEDVEKMVREIIGMGDVSDYISFEIKGLEAIAEHRKYNGVRVNLIGRIKNTKTPFCIDFGVGDVIVPAPAKRLLPVLLSDFQRPEVLTYSLESIIAEKFDAIITRMELNGRMKDFFDIYYLASTCDFEGRKLQEAIYETLQNRGTSYEKDSLEHVGKLLSDKDILIRWNAFCNKILRAKLDFEEVLSLIIKILEPLYTAIINESECFGIWKAKEKNYK